MGTPAEAQLAALESQVDEELRAAGVGIPAGASLEEKLRWLKATGETARETAAPTKFMFFCRVSGHSMASHPREMTACGLAGWMERTAVQVRQGVGLRSGGNCPYAWVKVAQLGVEL